MLESADSILLRQECCRHVRCMSQSDIAYSMNLMRRAPHYFLDRTMVALPYNSLFRVRLAFLPMFYFTAVHPSGSLCCSICSSDCPSSSFRGDCLLRLAGYSLEQSSFLFVIDHTAPKSVLPQSLKASSASLHWLTC